MLSNLRHALRSLAKSPGFTTVALLTLALGIGVNTSMFSMLRRIAVRTLPYPEGDRLVRIFRETPQGGGNPHSPANFLDQREQNSVFSNLAALQWASFNLAENDQPAERFNGMLVTADFFPLLGVSPALGRVFTADEDRPGNDRVLVLSHEFWSSHFAADRSLIGREIRLNGQPVTVIGVMPPGFNDPLLWGPIDAWRPLALTDAQRATRRSNSLTEIARLKPGVSFAQAQNAMHTLAHQLAQTWPDVNARMDLRLVPLARGSRIDDGGRITWLVMGLAGAVLLIACANLANLQFARIAGRGRDIAVRAALGASRARLLREVLGESLLLALAGGGLGLLVALWCNDALGSRVMVDGQPGLAVPLDPGALGFAVLVSGLTGIGFGLLPAWLASRVNVSDALKQGARGTTPGRAQHRMRHALVVAEMALALVLLASAAFFVGGLKRFAQRDLGWRPEGIFSATFNIGSTPEARSTPERLNAHRAAIVERWEERLAHIPGVERVALARRLPTWTYGNTAHFAIETRPDAPAGLEPVAFVDSVTPGFFDTLGLRVLAGRSFTSADRAGSPPVTIINESMARTLWPGQNPIGQRIGSPDPANRLWREVVGVVSDARSVVIGDGVAFQVYRPWSQVPDSTATLALRSSLAPESLLAEVRRIAAEIDPSQPIYSVGEVSRDIERYGFNNLELAGGMLAGFAFLGLSLAALGIYAVIANSVVQRTHEIGVRMALGAQVHDVLALVVGRGLRLILVGTALGLAGAWGINRLLAAIFPVPTAGLATSLVSTAALLAVATLACWLPARRATKVDPLIALRAE
jgi:predicted permease